MFKKLVRITLLPIIVTILVISSTFVLIQQSIRLSANDELNNVADSVISAVEKNRAVLDNQPQDQLIDPTKSNAIFIQAYNEDGSLIFSTLGIDNDNQIKIPKGVLDNVNPVNSVTWSPKKDIRLATTAKKFGTDKPGYILTGKSLRNTEFNAHKVGKLAILAIVISTLAILIVGVILAFFDTERVAKIKESLKNKKKEINKKVEKTEKVMEAKVVEKSAPEKAVPEKSSKSKATESTKSKSTTKKK